MPGTCAAPTTATTRFLPSPASRILLARYRSRSSTSGPLISGTCLPSSASISDSARCSFMLLDGLGRDRAGVAVAVIAAEQREQQGRTPPQAEIAPGPLERDVDVAIDQLDGNAALGGSLGRGDQLGAGLHAEARADPALIARQREVREQVQRPAFAHDLEHVEIAERAVLGERLVARLVELDADHIRVDRIDRRAHVVDRFLRHVRGADDIERRLAAGEHRDRRRQVHVRSYHMLCTDPWPPRFPKRRVPRSKPRPFAGSSSTFASAPTSRTST